MAVRLRLRRMGRKKRPFYRIVAADQRSPRDGRFIETLGYYNPLDKPHTVEIDEERVMYWLSQGAQPSTTVNSLLRRQGILLKRELQKQGLDQAKIEEELKKWELLQLERQKRREAKEAQAKAEKKKKKEEDQPEEEAAAEAEVKTEEAVAPAEKAEQPAEAEAQPEVEAAEEKAETEAPVEEKPAAEEQKEEATPAEASEQTDEKAEQEDSEKDK